MLKQYLRVESFMRRKFQCVNIIYMNKTARINFLYVS